MAAGPGIAVDVGSRPFFVPGGHVAQVLLAEQRPPGQDQVGLQKGHGLLVGREHILLVMHPGKTLLPLVLDLVVQTVRGDDAVLKPQGDHGLDRPLVDRHHPFGGLFIGIGHLIAGVVVVGDGHGVISLRRLRTRRFRGSRRVGSRARNSAGRCALPAAAGKTQRQNQGRKARKDSSVFHTKNSFRPSAPHRKKKTPSSKNRERRWTKRLRGAGRPPKTVRTQDPQRVCEPLFRTGVWSVRGAGPALPPPRQAWGGVQYQPQGRSSGLKGWGAEHPAPRPAFPRHGHSDIFGRGCPPYGGGPAQASHLFPYSPGRPRRPRAPCGAL